jgi:PAS domain S-box-containing protein
VTHSRLPAEQRTDKEDMTIARNPTTDTLAADIMTCMQEAVVYADLEGIIRYWNHGSEMVFGFSADEAVGQSVDIIVPEKMRKAHWDGYNKAIAHGDTLSGRGARMTRALQKSGEPLYVEMSFAMVRNQAGTLTGSIAVARDATARYMAERAARLAAAPVASASTATPPATT